MTGVQKGIKIAAIVLAIFIICVIINAILSLVGILGYPGGDNDFIQSYNGIDNVEIDIGTANIEIKYGAEFRVEANNVSDNFEVRENNGNLYIEEDGFWIWGNTGGDIILYVPSELDELNIDTGAGTVVIDDIIARKFNLDQGSGTIKISNSEFYESEIDGGTGNIDVTGSILRDMELDCGVGDVNITAEVLGKSSVSAGVGSIDLSLNGGEELYTLRIDKGLGNLDINGTGYKSTTYGNGSNKIDIDGGIGNIDINFN